MLKLYSCDFLHSTFPPVKGPMCMNYRSKCSKINLNNPQHVKKHQHVSVTVSSVDERETHRLAC